MLSLRVEAQARLLKDQETVVREFVNDSRWHLERGLRFKGQQRQVQNAGRLILRGSAQKFGKRFGIVRLRSPCFFILLKRSRIFVDHA